MNHSRPRTRRARVYLDSPGAPSDFAKFAPSEFDATPPSREPGSITPLTRPQPTRLTTRAVSSDEITSTVPAAPISYANVDVVEIGRPSFGNLYLPATTGEGTQPYLRSSAQRALEHLRSLAPPRSESGDESFVANSSQFCPVRRQSTRSQRVSQQSAFSLTDHVTFSDAKLSNSVLSPADDVSSQISNEFCELSVNAPSPNNLEDIDPCTRPKRRDPRLQTYMELPIPITRPLRRRPRSISTSVPPRSMYS